MSGERYVKQAVIASMIEHPDADKIRKRAFSEENIEAFLLGGAPIRKADLFTPDDEGRILIDSPGFWKNFDKVKERIGRSGDVFEYGDFVQRLTPAEPRTLLDSARQHKGLDKIFTAGIWDGDYDGMERLWYKVPLENRKEVAGNQGYLNPALKREVLASEGRPMPEDRLARADLARIDLENALKDGGDYMGVKDRLAKQGDWLRMEYMLLPDAEGNTLFAEAKAWDRYRDIVQGMAAHGERPEVSDFLHQRGDRLAPIARAAHFKALDKVFTPEHWESRLEDMARLWSYIPGGWMGTAFPPSAFDNAYAEAESLTFGSGVDYKRFSSKADLLQPLNPESDKPTRVVGLKAFWRHFPEVRQRLDEIGEKLSLSDLRQPSGQLGDTGFMVAVKNGYFASVAEIAQKSGEKLSADDFLAKDNRGMKVLDILAERKELSVVFTPDLWRGRVQEMKKLWLQVPPKNRDQVDILQVEVAAKKETIYAANGPRFKFPSRRPGG